jgi:uroporphyrinogen decarboxylase
MPILNEEFIDLTSKLDLEAFWAENEQCFQFTTAKPRCPVSFSPDDHWIMEFVDVPSTVRYYHDKQYRDALHKQVNDETRKHVGRAFFDEDTLQNPPKRIENLFRCEFSYIEGGTPWLMHVTDDPKEFAKVLDEAEATDMRAWALTEEFLAEWDQRKRDGRELPKLGTGSRGPATIMTSILQPEVVFYWASDHTELMERFRDILARKMVELNTVLREFSGNTTPGWWITDDNSCLFSPRLYRQFCYPVLEQVLGAMAPGEAERYQHSDSAMGHLMDQQYALGIRRVNYGPTVDPALIREKMPKAWIDGQMPPFLLRNGTPEEIRARVIDDFRKGGLTGAMTMTTAGSLSAGTGVGRMRYFMQCVQECCRY